MSIETEFLDCRDVTFREGLEQLIGNLIGRYGKGYDRLKTLSNIRTGLQRDWKLVYDMTEGE